MITEGVKTVNNAGGVEQNNNKKYKACNNIVGKNAINDYVDLNLKQHHHNILGGEQKQFVKNVTAALNLMHHPKTRTSSQ